MIKRRVKKIKLLIILNNKYNNNKKIYNLNKFN